MKKFISIILTLSLAIAFMLSFSACEKVVFKAVEITGIKVEEYGFAISKDATNKDVVLAAMNEVIEELGIEKINEHLTYHALKEQGDNTGTPGFTVTEPETTGTDGILVMYTNAAFPPYEYVVGTTIQGLDVDMMKLVAVKLNMSFEIVDIDFETLPVTVNNLETGKTKVIAAGMTITEQREQTLDFSDPYMSSIQYIVCAEDKDYTSIADLKGLKIGVQLGTTGNFLISDEIEDGDLSDSNTQLFEYKSAELAFAALRAGKIDVVVIDQHPANSLVDNQ